MRLSLLFILIYFLSISNIFGHVGLNYPLGGEHFNSGDVINIQWYIAIDHGDCNWDLYFSPDSGISWTEIRTNLSKSSLGYEWTVPDSTTDIGRIKVVQDNSYGIDYEAVSGDFSINSVTTGIISKGIQAKEFLIYPVYPNPFNSSTIISFNLPEQGHVKIDIYNLVGQKVKTLVNIEMSEGLHKINWNADDLSSGVYIYSIETKRFSKIGRAILVK